MGATPGIRRGLCLAIAVLAALVVAGCGGTGTKSEGDVADVPQRASQRTDGRLGTAPKPMRLADLKRAKRGTPEFAVLQLLYFAQWGSPPNVADLYHPLVRNAIGVSNVVGTYSQLREYLSTSRVRFVESTKSPAGAFLTLELLRSDAAPVQHSFLLRRYLGRWRVVYDTLLQGALGNYVATSVSRNPAGKVPDRRAQSAGRNVARAYRDLAASTNDR